MKIKQHATALLVFLFSLVTLSGCDAFRTLADQNANTSLGKPYELILVCTQPQWEGALGDTLRNTLCAPVAYINQTEPLFDVLRILPRGYTSTATRHRNILLVTVDPTLDESQTGITAQYDVNASPQIVLTLQGPTDEALIRYLSDHGRELVYVLEKAERDRAIAFAERFNEKHLGEVIHDTFGIRMEVPKGYMLAKSEPDFLWARYEYPAASQGFTLYSYPYEGRESLTPEALLAARNRFVSRIPGPSDGSYMTTSEAFSPDVRMFRLEGRLWIEMRGFWDVAGDFMGGPFVSYTTIDPATRRVITLDGYVYSPKLHKRNFLRGVEHLLYLIHLPASTATEPAEAATAPEMQPVPETQPTPAR